MAAFVTLLFYSLVLVSLNSIALGSVPCAPLPLRIGVVVSCENPSTGEQIPCTGPVRAVPRKTLAKYKCEADKEFSAESVLKCICRGRWKGLDTFDNYTSSCSSIQRNFSLSGPPELNLSPDKAEALISANASSNQTFPGYALDALLFHNFYRQRHGATPLKLNSTLSDAATSWAQHLIDSNKLETEPWSANKSYISNLYQLSGPSNFNLSSAAKLAVGKWYSSGANYNYDVPSANSFSAMIWNSTSDLGVGIVSKGGSVIVVANYWPPGNVYVVGGSGTSNSLELFKKNVFRPVTNSSATDASSA